ncbi:hypothetical protein Ae406Ps2_0536c [Pseudonocardia sp. Ae406_Ps2]|nr:hypothetical protein Ae406Ps2_0536c [Pseudonocardia sp. Ae406_Ps2]OLM07673.1 hypothetical protein Ae331Ps2_5383 [Pseudonocardia sp. Ae331_Ps2]OLM22108.1 hypothetical protein Ae706Ps2_0540c [Pseudonocardia sp. Ae706_Ps2]
MWSHGLEAGICQLDGIDDETRRHLLRMTAPCPRNPLHFS